MNKFLRILIVIFATLSLLLRGPVIYAFDIPTAPTAPQAPTPPPAPPPPDTSDSQPPAAPTPPPSPTWDDTAPTLYSSQDHHYHHDDGDPSSSTDPQTSGSGSSEQPDNAAGGVSSDAGVGGATVSTGAATNAAVISTDANSNTSTSSGGSGGGATIINDANGSGSNNSGSVSISNGSATTQGNAASLVNNLYQDSTTGDNSASKNVGGSSISTGDANTTGTIITSVNTNIDGVMVAEFNIADDHLGDIILDFGAGCISGCQAGDTSLLNSGNGADSTNTALLDSAATTNTFQNNDATVENNMTLAANSGDNTADKNTGGNSSIDTGDANVSANLLTFANNNIAGGVIYAVVNIFGNLVGDIIFPDGTAFPCCLGAIDVANTQNGSGSTNTGEVNVTNDNELYQFNTITLENNLYLDASTGNNDTVKNTGGNSSIETGDSTILAQVVNIANNNLVGGNWWLVIVNEAGQWIGRILGAPDGASMGGSPGFEFIVNEAGEITIVNSGNGADSTNTGTVNQTTNNTIFQTNEANIVNNLNLSANTGGNSASKNTGGDSSIVSGDANIITNIVNFVNNNIVGNGRLFVTLVNVFGSWLGDFVGPGQEKELSEQGLGGVQENPAAQSQGVNSQGSGGSSGGSGNSQSGAGVGGVPRVGGALRGVILSQVVSEANLASLPSSVQSAVADAKKSVNVNLAWILAGLFPIGIVTTMIRRRKAIVRVLTFFL